MSHRKLVDAIDQFDGGDRVTSIDIGDQQIVGHVFDEFQCKGSSLCQKRCGHDEENTPIKRFQLDRLAMLLHGKLGNTIATRLAMVPAVEAEFCLLFKASVVVIVHSVRSRIDKPVLLEKCPRG